MKAIAVIGAAGIIGKSFVDHLIQDPEVENIVAIDRVHAEFISDKVDFFVRDISQTSIADLLNSCSSVVYLLEDGSKRFDPSIAVETFQLFLSEVALSTCPAVVLLSSAFVYGAYADNPVPIVEGYPARPIPSSAHAMIKCSLEEIATRWMETEQSTVAILRPVTVVNEGRMSWISSVVRSAGTVRSGEVESPFQFLYIDDLASALGCVAKSGVEGTYNVSPTGWIGATALADLNPDPEDKVLVGRMRSLYIFFQRIFGFRSIPAGLEPYMVFPWVVSNDKIRQLGWEPLHTNEEAYIRSRPIPPWRRLIAKRRQEVALVAALAGVGLSVGFLILGLRRFFRR